MSVAVRNVVLPTERLQSHLSVPFRWMVGALGLAVVAFVGVLLSRFVVDPVRFPVSNINVSGTLDYTDREALRNQLQSHTELGFYALDVDAIRDSVKALPWIAEAHVRREWPSGLMIRIEEHEPAARWNDSHLVSKRLELFKPPQLEKNNIRYAEWQDVFASLPRLAGADGRHSAVLDSYRRYSQMLQPVGGELYSLVEDERRSQTLELENQVTVRLGYEEHALRLDRFLAVYDRLVVPLDGQEATFDMRYSNGFALSGARRFSQES